MNGEEINQRTKKPFSEEVQMLHKKIEKCIREHKDLYFRVVELFDALRRKLGIKDLGSFMKDIFVSVGSPISYYEARNNKATYCWISKNYAKAMPLIEAKLVSMIPDGNPHRNVISQLFNSLFKDLDQNENYINDIDKVTDAVRDCIKGFRVESIKRKFNIRDLVFNDAVIQKIEDFLLNIKECDK